MAIIKALQEATTGSLKKLYGQQFTVSDFQVNLTKPEFVGDYTVVLFSLLKKTGKQVDALGTELGTELIASYPQLFSSYNIIKGFLNLSVTESYWLEVLSENYNDICFGKQPLNGKKVMVEYSS